MLWSLLFYFQISVAPYGCQVSVMLTAWFWFQSSLEVTTVTGVSNVV